MTLSRSPSLIPGHQLWLKITAADLSGSCTHAARVFDSPTFTGGGAANGDGVALVFGLYADWAVLDLFRLYRELWD